MTEDADSTTQRQIEGSCLCGAVRYQASETGVSVNCHCSRCRKWHGAAFASIVRIPMHAFRITSGAEALTRYASSPGIDRCFCKVCGSSLFTLRIDLGRAHVRLGTLDGEPGVRPSRHIFVASKARWFEITDSLPQHDAFPPAAPGAETASGAQTAVPSRPSSRVLMNILRPHVSLNVASVEASVAFYAKLFGAEVKNRRPGHASFDLSVPSLFLVLDERPRTGVNADHFGVLFATAEDLNEAALRLQLASIASTREGTKIWLRDPDGNAWEFFTLPPASPPS